jgi:hypothetical protein
MLKTIRREWRVAFSRGGQSTSVRLAKWAVFLFVAAALHESRFFWIWTAGLLLLAISIHLFYRWKTNGWTRAWGGWDELDFDTDDSQYRKRR